MYKLLFLGTLPAVAFAAISYPPLLARADEVIPCDQQGLQTCGDGCIEMDYTCCPDKMGGCPADTYCSLGGNGEYGCCPKGETCGGNGGVSSSVISISVSSAASSVIVISESSIIPRSSVISASSAITSPVLPSEVPIVSSSYYYPNPSPSISTPYGTPTPEYTTSTIYSTCISTVTSCTGTGYCPANATYVVTDYVPISTTVCTVSKPAPTYGYTTSTIYATSIYTTTSCAPEVAYCPASSTVEVTDVYAVSTTVCAVTEKNPYPTQVYTEAPNYPATTQPTTLYPTGNSVKYTTYAGTSSQLPVAAGASERFGTASAVKLFGALVVAALAAL